jgi:hypothetical protein
MARSLRRVEPDEAPRRAPTTAEAVRDLGQREVLVAMRDKVAAAIDDSRTHPRDLAPLTRRLLELMGDIAMIDAEASDDDVGSAASTPDQEWAAS